MPSRRDVLAGLSTAGAVGFAGRIGIDEDRFSAGTEGSDTTVYALESRGS